MSMFFGAVRKEITVDVLTEGHHGTCDEVLAGTFGYLDRKYSDHASAPFKGAPVGEVSPMRFAEAESLALVPVRLMARREGGIPSN